VQLFLKTLPDLITGNYQLMEQDESKATYWEGRTPADGEIKPNMTVDEVDRLVRATAHPYPGAFCFDDEGNKVIVWEGSKDIKMGKFLVCIDGKYFFK
jgi:methionyl-tRNA formyltransferase